MKLCQFYGTTIGKKVVAAVTGCLMFLFVLVHMLGNLKTFMGVDSSTGVHHLDLYAQHLRDFGAEFVGHGGVLWLTRIGLLVIILIHVFTVWRLRRISTNARPVGYKITNYESSTYAARTMWWLGLILLMFIVFHILHFTVGTLHASGFIEGAVYSNVYRDFQLWPVLLIYVVSMIALSFHLYHGIWSLCQTLGFDSPERNSLIRGFAKVMAIVIFIGFLSVPVCCFFNILPEPGNITLVNH